MMEWRGEQFVSGELGTGRRSSVAWLMPEKQRRHSMSAQLEYDGILFDGEVLMERKRIMETYCGDEGVQFVASDSDCAALRATPLNEASTSTRNCYAGLHT